MQQIYEQIIDLARDCGVLLLGADRSRLAVDSKAGHANFVTEYDTLVQSRLQKGLYEIMPEAGFFGEEGTHNGFPDAEYVFIVDPIDGTTNFLKGLSLSAIAISLTKNKERRFGLVYNPFTDELFSAAAGEGAFLNHQPIHVSAQSLANALAIFGTSAYYEGYPALAFQMAKTYMERCIDVRRLGSAELDLCYVACGRAELYFEPLIQPWDFAAGSLILEEAGGHATRWDGTALDVTKPCSVLAYGSGITDTDLKDFRQEAFSDTLSGNKAEEGIKEK